MAAIPEEIAGALQRISKIDLPLSGCGRPDTHGLPPPVVVTLARRPDRWQAALRNLRASGIHHIIKAEGVDGRQLSDAQIAELAASPGDVNRPLDEYLQLTRPAIGCFLSHLAIWKRFLQSGEERILIVEDDAVPSADFTPERARQVMAALPPDADMLLLGCTIMDGLAEPTSGPMFTRIFYYNGTYAYLLTRTGCLALLPHMLPLRTHVDNQISLALVAESQALRVYCCEPRLFTHDFTVLSDVYVPVSNEARADRTLAAIFERSRAKLLAEGIRLLPKYERHHSA